jgi:PAS domain S-box-containing protein
VPQPETDLAEFFDLSIDPLSIIGVDGEFKRVNASLVRLLGYPKAELFSRSVLDILHPDDVDPAREALSRLADGRDLVGFEARVTCADGSVRWLEWNARSMPERDVVYSVGRDTTERRRAAAELREAQRLLEASHDELRALAREQAALRRVATLVAGEASRADVFTAIAEECAALFGIEEARMMRFEAGPSELVVASSRSCADLFPVGSRYPLGGENASARVFRTGRPARVDDFATTATGPIGEAGRSAGRRSVVATPVIVAGRLWGALTIGTYDDAPLPPHAESRVAEFTELMATAIANTESRARADRLADEQASLRRVATLVAHEAPLEAVFAKVAEDVARTVGEVDSALWRDEGDGTVTAVAVQGPTSAPGVSLGTRLSLDGDSVIARALREGRPHRIDDYSPLAGTIAERARELGMGSAVGCPIVVGSRTWGAMTVAAFETEPLAPETESRVARFSDLVATAIANAEARAEVERLAHEQAALRRVATLVARGTPSDALFSAVCDEVEAIAGADASAVIRFEADGTVTLMGTHAAVRHPVGARLELDPDYIIAEVHRTGRAARFDTDDPAAPGMPEVARAERVRSALASPIVVEGDLWGAITTASRERPLALGMERRLADFTELVATAISNLQARGELAASRARIAAAADDERRRVVRDLHDGAQQRLVQTVMTLKMARHAVDAGGDDVPALLDEAVGNAMQAMAELRELSHGIMPALLTRGGLRAGIAALGSRTPVPVEIDVSVDRLPAPVEATAYFVVAEALTNAAKHSSAGHAEVLARIEDGVLRVEVRDDGVGGASPDGTGLVGLADRLAVLDGRLEVDSPPGGGTRLTAAIPLPRSDRSAGA